MSVQFDALESSLLYNTEFFDVKRRVTQKLYVLLEALRLQLKDTGERLQFSFPEGVTDVSGKISQGEHYAGFPWVMLDYPRYFKEKEMFAFRGMFWFGHYFSAHFVLGGAIAGRYVEQLLRNRDRLPAETYFSVHDTPWRHAVGGEDARLWQELSAGEVRAHVTTHGFIKLSQKWAVTDGDLAAAEMLRFYVSVLECLS